MGHKQKTGLTASRSSGAFQIKYCPLAAAVTIKSHLDLPASILEIYSPGCLMLLQSQGNDRYIQSSQEIELLVGN